ncbi:hypothetical protein ACOT4E_13190 [Acinetobacter baumannii]
MDKKALQAQFEEFARWYALPLGKSEDGVYQALETQSAWMSFQHQQAKVEELQNNINLLNEALDIKEQLNQKLRGREDELQKQLSEYIFVSETLDEMYVKEVQKSDELQEEFAEDERFLKEQIKDKDLKISNLEYQQGVDKELIQTLQCKVEKLQKQIDALEKSYFVLARIKSIASKNLLESILIKEVRQALKGEG